MKADNPIAVILGGTLPHISLVENLKLRGYYTILVDYFANPPAKQFADEHIQASTLDKDKVLEIASSKNADLVISICIDQANVTACYVAEKLNLPAPYSYETSLTVTDKILMKSIMIKNDIPTSKFETVSTVAECADLMLNYPLIVKPADSNSSKGVRRVNNYHELTSYIEDALNISRNKKAIIEEFIIGKEIGIDCFVKNKEATVLITKERRKICSDTDRIQQIYGCIWPENLDDINYDSYKQIAEKIASAFKLDNTPLMIQAIVNNDGINVIEFGARFGGGESFRIIKLSTGFDITNAAIDSFLGIDVSLNNRRPKFYYADNFIYTNSGEFGSIINYEHLVEDKTIEYLDSYKTKGSEINKELSSNNRVGVFTVGAFTKSELFSKIDKALNQIEVINTHGQCIMRKDIYKKENFSKNCEYDIY
jgi:phosphoribosylamine-glycine ligase